MYLLLSSDRTVLVVHFYNRLEEDYKSVRPPIRVTLSFGLKVSFQVSLLKGTGLALSICCAG